MMSTITPAVLAADSHEYREQIERIAAFTTRVHIDLMDGEFAPTKSLNLGNLWWPHHMQADIHLMYQRPMEYADELIRLNPHMVIVHSEADIHHMHFAAKLHQNGIQAGIALLPETPEEKIERILHSFDHLLIFSGELGRFGGIANLDLLTKIQKARAHHPELEIGWDGGINNKNVTSLIKAGVEVLCVGGYIQKSPQPQEAYATLEAAIKQGTNDTKKIAD